MTGCHPARPSVTVGTFHEVDGDVKYTAAAGRDSLLVEKLRQERLERAGFGVARVAAKEATSGPLLLERVNRASARGG